MVALVPVAESNADKSELAVESVFVIALSMIEKSPFFVFFKPLKSQKFMSLGSFYTALFCV
jgi:hypothetical protein